MIDLINMRPPRHPSKFQMSKTKKILAAIAWQFLFGGAFAAEGVFSGKMVSSLGGDARPCAFFTLDGVSEATPLVPSSPWFVLPIAHPKYKEHFAVLLSAKLSGRALFVVTTGGVYSSCGHAEVVSITLL